MPDRSPNARWPTPRVSVVIPVYNGEAYLAEAIESVLGQTLHELELVVVDDGSQDGTHTILDRFARADPRVRIVLNERNLGISGARNRGWQVAEARYVAVLDADDVALPDRLSRQAEFLDAHPSVAAVGGSAIAIDATGRRMSTRRFPTKPRVIHETLMRHNCLGHSAMTMRRSALECVGGYRLRTTVDYDLWLRLSERFELANLVEPVVLVRLHLYQHSVAMLEHQTKTALAVRAAARARRAGGVDPLAGIDDSEIFNRLEIDQVALRRTLARELIAQAAILADLGHQEQAEDLVDQASQRIGGRAPRAFEATKELKQAETLLQNRRQAAAASHALRAFRREPRYALSLLTKWLGTRVPAGGLLRWT